MYTREDFPGIGYKIMAVTMKLGLVRFEAHSINHPKHLIKGRFFQNEDDALDDLFLQCVVRSSRT